MWSLVNSNVPMLVPECEKHTTVMWVINSRGKWCRGHVNFLQAFLKIRNYSKIKSLRQCSMNKCNKVFWTGSWNWKRTLVKTGAVCCEPHGKSNAFYICKVKWPKALFSSMYVMWCDLSPSCIISRCDWFCKGVKLDWLCTLLQAEHYLAFNFHF